MGRVALVLSLVAGCGRVQFAEVDRDRDGDGIVDEIDLCPDVDSDNQHDEDSDGDGDICDPCPHLAGDAADADGDGVGDACDPQPDVAGEQIRAFLPFTEAEAPFGWGASVRGTMSPAEQWVLGADIAHVALTADHVALFGVAAPPQTELRIETELVIEAIAPPAGNLARNFAIIDNYDLSSDTGLFFGAVFDSGQPPPADASILHVQDSSGDIVFEEEPLETNLRIGDPYYLSYTRRGDDRFYTLRGGEGTRELQAVRSDVGGSLGIRARGITIAFRYVILIY